MRKKFELDPTTPGGPLVPWSSRDSRNSQSSSTNQMLQNVIGDFSAVIRSILGFLTYFAGRDWSSKICNRKTGLHGTKWWFVVRFNARSISPQIRRSDGFRSAKEHLDRLKFVYALLFLFTTNSFHFRGQYCVEAALLGLLTFQREGKWWQILKERRKQACFCQMPITIRFIGLQETRWGWSSTSN